MYSAVGLILVGLASSVIASPYHGDHQGYVLGVFAQKVPGWPETGRNTGVSCQGSGDIGKFDVFGGSGCILSEYSASL